MWTGNTNFVLGNFTRQPETSQKFTIFTLSTEEISFIKYFY